MDCSSILVVEDDPAVRTYVASVLRSAGYEVHATGEIEEARRLASTRRLDVLLSDVVLGPVDGLDVEEVVRMRHPEVKTLFMSGYARPRYRTGVEDPVLVKPFGPDELLERIGALLAPA
jgi:two-component system cell cycle sensor histidine kinase/response regulator CckA